MILRIGIQPLTSTARIEIGGLGQTESVADEPRQIRADLMPDDEQTLLVSRIRSRVEVYTPSGSFDLLLHILLMVHEKLNHRHGGDLTPFPREKVARQGRFERPRACEQGLRSLSHRGPIRVIDEQARTFLVE